MKDDQIKHMVDRFLQWKLPENFNPDGGISFKKAINENRPSWPQKNEPVGTNLLDATQAEEMVRYMVEGLQEQTYQYVGICNECDARWGFNGTVSRCPGCTTERVNISVKPWDEHFSVAAPSAPAAVSETEIQVVSDRSELTCEHREWATVISYGPRKYCCYVCWLERALDTAEAMLNLLRAKPSAEGDGWIEFVSSLLPELDAAERLAQKVDRVHGLKLAFAIRKVSNRIIERAEQPAVAKETLDVERAEKWLRNSGYVANSAGMRYIAGLLHDYSLTVARSAAEGDGWISVTPETMPPERERVLADFENHPVEISSWFQWETMEAPLWIPGVREWGRVRRWRKLPSGQGDEAIQTEREKDHCELCHGAKGGVKGNENVVGGVVLCDYCHAGWRETVWPSPHRLPRSKEKCE